MPYDEYGRGIDHKRSVGAVGERTMSPLQTVVFGIALVLAAILLTLFISKRFEQPAQEEAQEEAATAGPRHDSMTVTYTYDGEAIRYYVMTDPDTQRQYIVNDRGGMCLREKRDTPYPETSERYRSGAQGQQGETVEEVTEQ